MAPKSRRCAGGMAAAREAHLLAQYGPEAGRGLDGEFVAVFGGAGMPLIFKDYYKHLQFPSLS